MQDGQQMSKKPSLFDVLKNESMIEDYLPPKAKGLKDRFKNSNTGEREKNHSFVSPIDKLQNSFLPSLPITVLHALCFFKVIRLYRSKLL